MTVKLRYSDFRDPYPAGAHSYTSTDHALIRVVKELFDKLYERRVLIRLVGVRLSGLVHGGYQINLLEDSKPSSTSIRPWIACARKYGKTSIQRAVAMGQRFHEFNPFNGRRAEGERGRAVGSWHWQTSSG